MSLFRLPASGFALAVLVWVALVAVPSAAHSASSPQFKVPCGDVASLATAISVGNAAGSARIWLAPGCTYTLTTPATVATGLPDITGDLQIRGGSGTILSRDPAAPAFRLFNVAAAGTLGLEQVTVQGGSTASLGGAILNAGTLDVRNVTFTGNTAGNGGAIANTAGATATVKGSTFELNTTTGVGGGGLIAFGTVEVFNSVFRNNVAPINGGGVNVQPGGVVTVKSSTFDHNQSSSLGGGLSNLGTLTLSHSTVTANTGSGGGGIATGNANVVLKGGTKIAANVPGNCNPVDTIPRCNG